MKRRGALMATMLLAVLSANAEVIESPSHDFYNRGNAHARAQEWGLAVVDYQRARLLAPNDPDVAANLRYVQAAARVSVAAPSFAQRLTSLTTPDLAAGIGLLGLIIMGCSLLLSRAWARFSVLLIGAPLAAFAVIHALGLRPLLHSAVVVGGPAAVQASPVPMADTLFSLPEATSVVISAERPDYLLVTTESGSAGWVPRAHLVDVLPPASSPAR